MAYVTAGDPDRGRSASVLAAVARGGADVIEVGVPFSDPLADGPVIQRASERALAAGMTLTGSLALIREFRQSFDTPIVLFTYANPVVRMDAEVFAREAQAAGVDGVLLLDYPVEEAEPLRRPLVDAGLDPIFLISPTTTDDRIRRSAELGGGFLYVISRLGVTGTRDALSGDVEPLLARVRALSSLPVAVGFGISRPAMVAEACRLRRRGGRGQRPGAGDCSACRGAGSGVTGGELRRMAEERPVKSDAEDAAALVQNLRRRIDELDELLVRTLSARAACALEVGRQKKRLGLEIYQPSREADVIAHVQRINPGPLNDASIKRLFERIIDEARRLEREAEPEDGKEDGEDQT